MKYFTDNLVHTIFLLCVILLVAVISGIFIFLGINALKLFSEGGTFQEFFFNTHWDPTGGGSVDGTPSFGAGGLILGSIVVTLGSIIIATPLAFGMALFFNEISPTWLSRLLRPLIEIFTGMPSVVIGFFGLVAIVPFLQELVGNMIGNHQTAGYGWGAAILVLVIMILPTIISISIDALRTIPDSVREASLALGSTRWQMMTKMLLPAAITGLATAVVLGMARAIGEALAVSLVLYGHKLPALNQHLPTLFFQPNINITQYIAIDFGESTGSGRDAYFTLAFVLLLISFFFVCISRYLTTRRVYQ
jgi:phosphate transport system permease protein